MSDIMLRIDNVSKQYKLGQIGGTTLYWELQRLSAKLHRREDPTRKIGERDYEKGETFLALDGISFDVAAGERVGIIGHNGAGKSTLLKLISRVTAPTSGTIGLNGRVASMLEVGTGFHPELTGRENIYMNGAILGMNKREIDAKMEDIIEFSECRQFIDTPVKRYSSGMYVKLAFSVAAHLDSEIMIMDEVLAVGDMAFQKKCLDKMSDVSKTKGRTILYVSHNMNTIRQLCERVVVLDHGKVMFDGSVEEGIEAYMGIAIPSTPTVVLKNLPRERAFRNPNTIFELLEMNGQTNRFEIGSTAKGKLTIFSKSEHIGCILKMILICNGTPVTTLESKPVIVLRPMSSVVSFAIDLRNLAPSKYTVKLILCKRNEFGGIEYLDVLMDAFLLEVVASEGFQDNQMWDIRYNGYLVGQSIYIEQ